MAPDRAPAGHSPLTAGRLVGLPVPVLAVPAAAVTALGVAGVALGRGVPSVAPVTPVGAAFAVAFVPFGIFVLRRVPGNPLGRLMLVGGLFAAVSAVSAAWSGVPPASWLVQWTWWPPYAVIPLLLLLAPDGALPSPRWRPVRVLLSAAAVLAGLALAGAALAEPAGLLLAPERPLNPAARALLLTASGAWLVMLAGCVAVLASLVLRWRRAESLQRGQLACLLPVLVLLVVGLALEWANLPYSWVPSVLALPLALTVAVLRYQLADLDLYVHRGLVWFVLTGLGIVTYVLVATAVGAATAQPGSPVASLLAAAAVAALLQPAQRLAQRGVGRLLYGRRDEPYAVISELARHLGAVRDPLAVLPEIAATIVDGLRVPYAAIRVTGDDGSTVTAAERGRWSGPPEIFPMRAHDRDVGELAVAPRRAGTRFTSAETRLLHDLAGQAALAAEACRSTLALARARDRLVLAREEERRRLRRDLHDGVASAIVGSRMVADVVRRAAPVDGPVPELVGTLTDFLDTCAAEVRELIDELRPAALDSGLATALTGLLERFEGRTPTVTLAVDGEPGELPAAVEVAAYRVVAEALTNVTKHAGARGAIVSVRRDARHLEVRVVDDGSGFDVAAAGAGDRVGLCSIRERAEELGGRCEITSGPGGTSVLVLLPLTA